MKDNIKNNILDIVKKNAKKVIYISEDEYLNNNLTDENIYIKFKKDNTIEYTNNNYIRKKLLINALNDKILPNISIKNNFIINVNMHDIYDKSGTLTFGSKSNSESILIPDIYQMYNYEDTIKKDFYDNIDFKDKINKIIFGGSTTGDINIKLNERINTCIWSNINSWAIKNTYFKITNIVQIPKDKLYIYTKKYKLNIESILSNNISIEQQLKYKYILSIDGNTWAWDRPIWIMSSNSLFFKYNSNNIGWYYDFLKEDVHYVAVNTGNMEKKYNFFENNTNQALDIINNSKKFVKDYCSEEAWTFYLKSLLEEISDNV
jgi:hypothetical protein